MKRLIFLFVWLLLCNLPADLLAQQRTTQAILDALQPTARSRVARTDTLLSFRTRAVSSGRLDVDAGVLRSAYRISASAVSPSAAPEANARAVLAEVAPDFGWTTQAEELRLNAVRTTRNSTHLTFQQTFYDLPVHKRQVKVNLDDTGRPTMVLSGYAPHLKTIRTFNAQPSISSNAAEAEASRLVSSNGARTSTPDLVVYPSERPRLAWRLLAWPTDAPAEWEVLIDAHTGDLIQLFDMSVAHAENGGKGEREKGGFSKDEVRWSLDEESDDVQAVKLSTELRQSNFADGAGLVFDPDPLTTAGVDYGGSYVDADDADLQALNDQRIEVVLNDITQGTDGLYRLEGPYVIVTGSSDIGGTSFQPPAEANPNAFRYTRNDDRFEAVMAYYHIDKSQRYVQSLNLGFDVQAGPLRINPHGLGNADDSKYYTGSNAIALGDGGIDDAEDADVIWHEYGHALLEGSAPGLLFNAEGQALHEGWSDYWAASYSRGLIDAGLVPNRDWRKVFTWDGNDSWNGRFLNSTATYPDGHVGNKYIDGDTWATTLMEIYTELGREVTDALNLLSHTYLNAPASFADAGMALVQADIDHFNAAHASVLVDILGARGYVDPNSFGPAIEHDPIPFVEQTGGSIDIEVEAVSVAQPVSRVVFVYSVNGGTFSELNLTSQGNDRYTGMLTLPAQAAEIVYYIEAFDQTGQRTRLPANAPQQTFQFEVGPDTEAPSIQHQAIAQVAIQAWPALVIAEVSDNQGVDSVWVSYVLEGPSSTTITEGSFGLTRSQNQFTGSFPISADLLEEGSRVLYRIHARDVADTGNEAVLPSVGMLQIEITVEGVLAIYTFENNEGLAATGAWERGEPSYGLRVPHAGQNVWSTGLNAPYPEQPSQATLALPTLNLAEVDVAYLSFWHWYDFEHSGEVFPDQATTEPFWDGGNIKVSSDGGTTWTVLQPQGGYNGEIETSAGNPLGGEPGFGGYSFGWRRVRAELPLVDNLMIRFDFGTDDTNELTAQFYGGWALDDVRVTTFLTNDEVAPTLLTPPPATLTADTGEPPPPLTVQAMDNVGLEAVLAEYTVVRSEGTNTSGTLRLAMAPTDLTTFSGSFPAFGDLTAGDHIDYRIRLQDFDGNSIIVPAAGEDPYRIDYRLAQTMNVLAGVQATGIWQSAGTGWIAAGDATQERSSLVLQPSDLPINTDEIQLTLTHSYRLNDGLGGNVQVSTNSGASWSPLMPIGGYNATFSGANHPMDGQPIFGGPSEGIRETVFDLTPYGGQQIRLRIDFGATRNPAADEFWNIASAELTYITFTDLEDGFDIPRTLALHPNFPDPFTDDTVLSYTLPEQMPVHLALYNMLGQRIALLVDGTQPAGTHTLTLRRGNLASGVYLLRMIAGDTQHVERMVITR